MKPPLSSTHGSSLLKGIDQHFLDRRPTIPNSQSTLDFQIMDIVPVKRHPIEPRIKSAVNPEYL
jgi:hypothetical protein